ncbi:MAG TPA: FAD/NAD(P)-binding protein [Mycobacteriales bacterium]|nr:FAD/NAD(P)-binding protein [Mycobacteriales bacterium]
MVGAGPRGLSLLERLCANADPAGHPVRVHVVDPYPPGAGRVWRTAQAGLLLMNTVAAQVTVFTDDSVRMAGPVVPGPSLYEWAQLAGLEPAGTYPDAVLAEAAALGPDSYPSRAFYGHYLRWAFRRVTGTAPDGIEVAVHATRAVALGDGPDGTHTVLLADGTRLAGLDAVVLTQGHLPVEPSAEERRLAAFAREHRLTYRPPANPADCDLSDDLDGVGPGEPVGLRGLGLNFFDHMALLTAGRGGTFSGPAGDLVYHPSGREPVLYAGSRRGVPYHSRGENQKGATGRHTPLLLTAATIAGLSRRAAAEGGLQFARDVWPLVAREVETVYYATMLRQYGRRAEAELVMQAYPGCPAPAALLDGLGIPPELRWDWDLTALPYGDRVFTGPADFREWLLEHLRADAAHARAGNLSGPRKAALDVLRDLRNEVRLLVEHGGLAPRSHREELDGWYTPLNAYLSIGPPVRRVDEMVALVRAGVVHVLGPGTRLTLGRSAFVLEAAAVPGSRVEVSALVEARLPDTDLRRTADPLVRRMLAEGRCTAYRVRDSYQTGGLAVGRRPNRVLDPAGRAQPRLFAFGVPTESVHWVTAAGARPGVDSVSLSDADAIARAVLELAAGRVRAAEVPVEAAAV